ncbi:MAG: hypothetical protein JSS49_22315 [Planctomycetes bacterium]|nr:hypothetical protein [Planctomycetota bacterium]
MKRLVLLTCFALLVGRNAAADADEIEPPTWIRARTDFDHGTAAVWFSPSLQVWYQESAGDRSVFCDAGTGERHEIYQQQGRVVTRPLGERSSAPIFPLSRRTEDNQWLGAWFFSAGQRIIDQRSREVVVGGKAWKEIEFSVIGAGPRMLGTLRVDPQNHRPRHLLFETPGAGQQTTRWEFDYPQEGPGDVSQLAPKAHLNRSGDLKEIQSAIGAIAASRARIGNLRVVITSFPDETVGSLWVVHKKGDRWRVDTYTFPQLLQDLARDVSTDEWGKWIESQLPNCSLSRSLVCDGNRVFDLKGRDRVPKLSEKIAPIDLLTGSSSGLPFDVRFPLRFYPDLTSVHDSFKLVPKPAAFPDGLLIQQSGGYAKGGGYHSHYYLDPARGHTLVKYELFEDSKEAELSADAKLEHTRSAEDFRQSPQGWWYPSLIRDTRRGEDATLTRYHFDFNADLQDNLFALDGNR